MCDSFVRAAQLGHNSAAAASAEASAAMQQAK